MSVAQISRSWSARPASAANCSTPISVSVSFRACVAPRLERIDPGERLLAPDTRRPLDWAGLFPRPAIGRSETLSTTRFVAAHGHFLFNYAALSIGASALEQAPTRYSPGAAPIFVPVVICPAGISFPSASSNRSPIDITSLISGSQRFTSLRRARRREERAPENHVTRRRAICRRVVLDVITMAR